MELGIPLRIFPPNPLFLKANSVLLQLYFSSFPSPFPFGVLRRSVVGLLGFLLLLPPLLCMRAFDGYGGMEEIKKGRNSGEEEEEEEKEATGKTMEDGAGFATKQNSIFEMDRLIHTEVRQYRCELHWRISPFFSSSPLQFACPNPFLLPSPPPSPQARGSRQSKMWGRRKKGKEERKLFSLPSPFFGSQKRNGRTNGADFFLGFPLFLQMLKEVVAL